MSMAGVLNSALAVCGILIIAFHNANAETPPIKQQISIFSDENRQFQQAVAFDLAGQPLQARAIYDRLKSKNILALSAVPSAINYVAMNNIPAATTAFTTLSKAANARDKEYAQLWLLWLKARQWTGSPAALQKQNSEFIQSHHWSLPWEKTIAQLYAGEISADALMVSVSMLDISAQAKSDAITEALFFADGYLQYVKNSRQEASELFQRYQHYLHSNSLERPILLKKHTKPN